MCSTGKLVGGDSFYVRDCYVWSEIQYLDSATDYREFLPERPMPLRPVIGSELMMLDSSGSYSALRNWAPVLAFLIVSAGMSGWLLYLGL